MRRRNRRRNASGSFLLFFYKNNQSAGILGPYARRRSAAVDAKALLITAGVPASKVKVTIGSANIPQSYGGTSTNGATYKVHIKPSSKKIKLKLNRGGRRRRRNSKAWLEDIEARSGGGRGPSLMSRSDEDAWYEYASGTPARSSARKVELYKIHPIPEYAGWFGDVPAGKTVWTEDGREVRAGDLAPRTRVYMQRPRSARSGGRRRRNAGGTITLFDSDGGFSITVPRSKTVYTVEWSGGGYRVVGKRAGSFKSGDAVHETRGEASRDLREYQRRESEPGYGEPYYESGYNNPRGRRRRRNRRGRR